MKFDRIRDLREDNDLTQDYLGKVLNVSQRTYSRYENDERAIPIEVFSKLADFYNTMRRLSDRPYKCKGFLFES